MADEGLVHVARLPGSPAAPEAVWLDMQTMRFVVVPVPVGDVGPAETPITPVEDYVAVHPDRAAVVREALRSRFAPPVAAPGGGAVFLARRQRVDAEALLRGVTPENCPPETSTGPAVGNEIW